MRKTAVIMSVFLTILLAINISTISAVTTTKSASMSRFKVTKRSNTSYWYEYKFPYIYIDNKAVYCLQPNITVISGSYSASNKWNDFSLIQQRRLSLIAYYGYEYPNHQTRNYYLAAQSLVWDVLGWNTVWYNTAGTSKLNVSSELAEINNLIARHNVVPSFANTKVDLRVNQQVTLTDTNGVLSEYEFTTNQDVDFTKEGNNLTIKLNKKISKPLTLSGYRRNNLDNGSSIIYTKSNSQNLLNAKADIVVNFDFSINLKENDLTIIKKDTLGQAVSNTTFLIAETKDMAKGVSYTTDNNGRIYLEDFKPGTHYIQEVSAPAQYIVDNQVKEIFVMENEPTFVELENSIRKTDIKIVKKDNETKQALKGAEFELYKVDEDKSELIATGTTNENGTLIFKDLDYYQSYSIYETKMPIGYDSINEERCWNFRPADNDYQPVIELEIYNQLRRIKLKLIKMDEDTKEKLLSGAVFSINENDSANLIGTYVTGSLYIKGEADSDYYVYSTDDYEKIDLNAQTRKVSYQFNANKDGEIIEQIPAGIYYLSQKELLGDISEADNQQIKTKSVEDGVILIEDLKYGYTYNVCEVQAPTGYDIGKNSCSAVTMIVDEGQDTIEKTYYNQNYKVPYTGYNFLRHISRKFFRYQ